MNFKPSLFTVPEKIQAGDMILSSVFSATVFLFFPASSLAKMNVDGICCAVVMPVAIFARWMSASLFYKKQPERLDPFYIRAWWGLAGGITAFLLCLLFRREALMLALALALLSGGEILGHRLYRRAH